MNVTVRPELLAWARNRASLTVAELAPKVGTKTKPGPIQEWEESDVPVEMASETPGTLNTGGIAATQEVTDWTGMTIKIPDCCKSVWVACFRATENLWSAPSIIHC